MPACCSLCNTLYGSTMTMLSSKERKQEAFATSHYSEKATGKYPTTLTASRQESESTAVTRPNCQGNSNMPRCPILDQKTRLPFQYTTTSCSNPPRPQASRRVGGRVLLLCCPAPASCSLPSGSEEAKTLSHAPPSHPAPGPCWRPGTS